MNSLDDLGLFDDMFDSAGSDQVPGKCLQCTKDGLCRACSPATSMCPEQYNHEVAAGLMCADGDSAQPAAGDVRGMAVLLAAAAGPPVVPTVSTPTTLLAGPVQTMEGVRSPLIPLVALSPALGTPPDLIASAGVKRAEDQKMARAARKRVTDAACQVQRKGKMKALQEAAVAYKAEVLGLKKTVRGLTASLQKSVGGTHNANATTRGGLHEHLLITRYEQWQALKFALEQAYCAADSTLAARSHFQNEAGDVRVEGRYMWNPIGSELFGGLEPLEAYADHLKQAGNGRLLVRSEGKFGRELQILDSGDCLSTEPLGECHRTYVHRDWDNNRLTSLTTILALTYDVMGYVFRNDNGELEDKIVTMEPGDMHVFPTSVYHFGCSHLDYNNTIEGMVGQTRSSLRRRVFCYLDWDSPVRDEEGFVDSATECPVPKDYNLKIVRGIPDASVAFTYLSSPMLEGRTMQFENNKLLGSTLAASPLGGRGARKRQRPDRGGN